MLLISQISVSSNPRLQIKSCTNGERHVVMESPVKIWNIKRKRHCYIQVEGESYLKNRLNKGIIAIDTISGHHNSSMCRTVLINSVEQRVFYASLLNVHCETGIVSLITFAASRVRRLGGGGSWTNASLLSAFLYYTAVTKIRDTLQGSVRRGNLASSTLVWNTTSAQTHQVKGVEW